LGATIGAVLSFMDETPVPDLAAACHIGDPTASGAGGGWWEDVRVRPETRPTRCLSSPR
jgi:hypothetical protein